MNSKAKGKQGERELASELNRLFGLACRRGQQFAGSPDSPDVVGLPGVHAECKRVEALNIGKAMEQAVHDAGANVPAVFHRTNRQPWLVTVRLDDLHRLARAVVALPTLPVVGRCGAGPSPASGQAAEPVERPLGAESLSRAPVVTRRADDENFHVVGAGGTVPAIPPMRTT